MPSTYAHYRFGQQVYQQLPQDIQAEIKPYKDLFFIGLHGPDLLFYYKPLSSNKINQIGYAQHDKSGLSFFEPAGNTAQKYKPIQAHFAYLYGFLCHFALDLSCHGYIDQKISQSGISHTEIEVEFDRYLLVRDGKDPLIQSLTKHIRPNNDNAKIISHFFSGVNEKQILKCMYSIIAYSRFLLAPHKMKRQFIYFLMKISGNDEAMHGLIMNLTPNPNCFDSCQKLYKLYKHAISMAVTMICEYKSALSGALPWRNWYAYTFSSKLTDGKTYYVS